MGTTLINGEWIDTEQTREVTNPVTGEVVGSIGYGSSELATQAVDAAAAAFPEWSELTPRERARFLHAAAAKIGERADEIGLLLARETGKRLPEAVGEVRGAAEYFTWFAEEARRPVGQVHSYESSERRHISVRRPAGVVASLTPWNFPCSIQARKLAPALAAGCTVVARVSEKAPLAVTEMFRCVTDAGIPSGVVNLVHGPGREITTAYVTHEAVRVVSFTGSTEVGKEIMELCSTHVTRPLLELGGDAPFIVFADSDLDRAVEVAMIAKFRNAGQSCIGANRFLLHEDIHDEFVAKFAERISAIRVGDGTAEPVPDLGPCIDAQRANEVRAILDDALSRGGRLAGESPEVPDRDTYVAPALVVDAPTDSRIAREEIFGPIAAAFRFSTDDEAYDLANDTRMGLAAYVCTRDASKILQAAERLQFGVIGVNDPAPTVPFAPMGGMKESGLGREGSSDGLHEFEEVVYLAISDNA